MNGYFTKRTTGSLSQNFPSTTPNVASDVTLLDTYVLLCDWHGHIVWKSGTGNRAEIGDEIWKHAASRSKDGLRGAVASVVTLRENYVLDVEGDRNEHFRFWMWPLHDPEIAVCILARRIPNEQRCSPSARKRVLYVSVKARQPARSQKNSRSG